MILDYLGLFLDDLILYISKMPSSFTLKQARALVEVRYRRYCALILLIAVTGISLTTLRHRNYSRRKSCDNSVTRLLRNDNAEDECLAKLCSKQPFSWVRWGDGETIHAGLLTNPRLQNSFRIAAHHPDIYLNVGGWFFCGNKSKELQVLWKSFSNGGRFYDYFYLNAGDPMSAKKVGWRDQIEKCSRKTLAVIPSHLRSLPVFRNSIIVPSPTYETLDATIREIRKHLRGESMVVLLAGGKIAKILAVELTLSDPNHTYIDIGSSMDGYAGRHSRDYNDPKNYCAKISSPKERERWFPPGACN